MFEALYNVLNAIAADAWNFGTGVLLILASLFMLYRAIQGTTALGFGSGQMAGAALVGIVGILIIVLTAFNVIPSFTELLKVNLPSPPWR